MKVLQINAYFGNGSTGKLTYDLYEFQKKCGIDAYVGYSKDSKYVNDDYHIMRINNKIGFLIHKYMFHIFGKQWKNSFFKTKKFLKKIDKINPDIVHLHNIHDYYINLTLLFKYLKKKNIPVVWTFHDCWAITGHCSHFFMVDCNKWMNQCEHCPMQRKGPRSLIFDNSKKCFNIKRKLFNNLSDLTVIPVSNWEKKIIEKSFLTNVKIETIYNWVDSEKFKLKSIEEKNELKKINNMKEKKIILSVSPYWNENKGIYDIVELANKLSDEYLVILIGKNVYNLTFPTNVLLLGYIPNEKLRDYYVMADIFLNLSKCESFGLTTLEALSCGTPCIVYNVSACPEVVGTDKKCGLVIKYDKDRVDNIYNGIKSIEKNEYSNYIKNCNMRVNNNFYKKTQLQKYINIYNKIYDEKKVNKK